MVIDSLLHEILNALRPASHVPLGRNAKSASDHDRGQWQDAVAMRNSDRWRFLASITRARVLLVLSAALAWPALPAQAVTLTQSDVALAVFAADGSSWRQLTSGALGGYFGAHRCACPVSLSAQLQLTSSGQTNLGTSTVSVHLLLGADCLSSPTSCVSLGQVSFSASQSAALPPFNSSLVF